MEQTVIFVPAPGIGHMLSTLEFANLLMKVRDDVHVSVLIMPMPLAPSVDSYIQSITATQPRLTIVNLPMVPPPPTETLFKSSEKYICDFIESNTGNVKTAIVDIKASCESRGNRVAGLVLDFFCGPLVDVANELSLSAFIFLTSNVGFLRFMQFLATHNDSFDLPDAEYNVPGFRNPVPASVLPSACFNKSGGYEAYLKVARGFKDVKGVVVNSFSELEYDAINGGVGALKVYPVGPVLNKGHTSPEMDQSDYEKVLAWMDKQPDGSVVFLCFGSLGGFPADQVKEIAKGLERANCRFLWHLRLPPVIPNVEETYSRVASPEEMLPEGFLERVKERGRLCGWVKQVEILGHRAIGGFVSHCGWNSTLESVWHGVPQAVFPIFAEQQLNAFMMVKEHGIAIEVKMDARMGFNLVTAEEVESAVRRMMEEEGDVREKVRKMGRLARDAVNHGGSSRSALEEFANDLLG